MARDFALRPAQRFMYDFISQHERCNLWAGMGIGKTSTCLALLDAAYNVWGESAPTLVLAPLRVAQSTWPNEVKTWKQFAGLRIAAAVGTPAERKAALRRDAQIVTINYDNLPWLVEQYAKRPWPFRRVIPDESTRLKSYRTKGGGARATALAGVARKASYWINLTGTPSPNGLLDLWGQQWFIDQGARLGRTFSAYQERWFRPVKQGEGFTWVPKDYSQEQIQERLADCTLTVDPKDWFDLKDPLVNVIEVDMPPRAMDIYRRLEKEMFARLESGEQVEVFNNAGLTMKCLQMASGAVYLEDGKTFIGTHDAKLEALESIVAEAAGAPILVAYHFKSDLARLQRAFPQARTLDRSGRAIDEWNAGRIPILLVHPASAGHGLNLQDGGATVVFYSHWWDLEQHDQVLERIGPMRQLQAGYDRPVFVHYLVARGTIDKLVMARRNSKRDVQSMLLEYMKIKCGT